MQTKSRRFASTAALAAVAVVGLVVFVKARRASSSEPPLEKELHAAYPTATATTATVTATPQTFAGVGVDAIALPGLRVTARENHTVDDGGIVLSFSDDSQVRVVARIALARDASIARRFVDTELHGVSTILPPSTDTTDGAVAYGDGKSILIGANGNLAFDVRVLDGATITAKDVVAKIRAAATVGTPAYPGATITMPSEMDAKTGVDIRVQTAAKYTVRAEGAYVAHGKDAMHVKPFAPGKVTVVVTLTDDYGRVNELRAVSTAK